jgi:hypothetical protein
MTSIWLRPQGHQEYALQSLINRLAGEHQTVSFRPHLTVCTVPGDLTVLDAAAAYIKECGLLPVTVTKTAVTGAVITPLRLYRSSEGARPALGIVTGDNGDHPHDGRCCFGID